MDDSTGYYQGQQTARPSPPSGQVPGQNRQVSKTDPSYLARKQLFAKLPEEWKKTICAETDHTKRLALFDMYGRKLRISEEHQQKTLAIQRMGAQYAQQRYPQNQPGYQQSPRPQMQAQPAQMHAQTAQMHVQNHLQQPMRQAKILRPVMAGQNPQGIKRNLSPTEVHQMQQFKRIKMEPMSPQDPYADLRSLPHTQQQQQKRIKMEPVSPQDPYGSGPNSPHTPQLQQKQPNILYIQQKMPDGQVRLVPATMVEQPGTNGRPVYVQTATGGPGMQNRMPQEVLMRRQVLGYRPTETGVRKLVTTNFSGGSPQPSPGSSAGSLDAPDTVAGRTVPEPDRAQIVTRRVTPNGIMGQRVGTPSPETVQTTPVTLGRVEKHLINRLGDNFLVRQSPSPTAIPAGDGGPPLDNLAPRAVRAIQQFISEATTHPMEPPRQHASPPPHVALAFVREQRKNPEYEKLILRLNKKFGEDIKRIIVRQKFDCGEVSKALENIRLILNFKFPLPKERWSGIEAAMQQAVDAYQVCFPAFNELKRVVKEGVTEESEARQRPPSTLIPGDPWKACREQIVHVPQDILEASLSGDY